MKSTHWNCEETDVPALKDLTVQAAKWLSVLIVQSLVLKAIFGKEKTSKRLLVVRGYSAEAKLLSEMQTTNPQITSMLLKILMFSLGFDLYSLDQNQLAFLPNCL